MTTTTTFDIGPKLSWGPRAGASVNALAQSDEGRGHLTWIARQAEAPEADRRAAREALARLRDAARRPTPPGEPAVPRIRDPRLIRKR
jgi:hypothetical protein